MEPFEIENRFTYHAPRGNQVDRYHEIRKAGLDFANLINCKCLDSPEKSLAIRKIEEAVFWANAAIARNE